MVQRAQLSFELHHRSISKNSNTSSERFPRQNDSCSHFKILKTSLFYKDNERFYFDSLIDSGADFCVFPANLGEAAGLNVFEGKNAITFGVGGKETLYFHKVKVEVIIKDEPWIFECRAGFSIKLNAKGIGFLGRDGFFDLFQEVSFNQKVKMFRLKEV